MGKALRVLGVEALLVPCGDHRLTGTGLAQAIDRAPDGADVVGVVATAGTTNAGLIDDLAGVADVAANAHCGSTSTAPTGRPPSSPPRSAIGSEASSGPTPSSSTPTNGCSPRSTAPGSIYRQPNLAKAVHTQNAAYLDVIHESEEWNPSDYAYHLTRRARGLPLWFSLATNGTDAYRDAIEAVLAMTRQTADHHRRRTPPRSHPPARALDRPLPAARMGVVRLRVVVGRLLADQVAFAAPTIWEGKPVGRLALLHPDTTAALIEEIVASMA